MEKTNNCCKNKLIIVKNKKSAIVSHHVYDKVNTDNFTTSIGSENGSNNSYDNEIHTKSKLKRIFTPPIGNHFYKICDFTLSDSEYDSLKNEKCSTQARTKWSVVRKICDSTTDAKLVKTKEISPEPKISTTTANTIQLKPRLYESSSEYTSYPSFFQDNRTIPFKKRIIHYLNDHSTPNKIHKGNDCLIREPTSSEISSSSLEYNQITTRLNQEQIEATHKVINWHADFQFAYNNEYIDFSEDQCSKLTEKINKDKLRYEQEILNKVNLTVSESKDSSLEAWSNRSNHSRGLRLSDQHLDSLKTHLKRIQTLTNKKENPASLSAEIEDWSTVSNSSPAGIYLSNKSQKLVQTSPNKKLKTASITPLSPETTKRNEFYSYLQISAKPRIRSDGRPVEPYRRSVRVKNIQINKQRDRSLTEDLTKEAEFLKPKTGLVKKRSILIEKNNNQKIDNKIDNLLGFTVDDKNKSEYIRNQLNETLKLLGLKKPSGKKKIVKVTTKKHIDQDLINHIDGPVTRRLNAAFNRTVTRSSYLKKPFINLDTVIKLNRKLKRKTKLKSKKIVASKQSSSPKQSLPLPVPLIEEIQPENKIQLSTINNETKQVQNSILELSTQYSCFEDNLSNSSFRGFGTPADSGETSESDESTSESYTDNSSTPNLCSKLKKQRRYSLPSYLNNQPEQKLKDLIASASVKKCMCHNNSSLLAVGPQSPRSFHQIFVNRQRKIPSQQNDMYNLNADSTNWSSINSNLTLAGVYDSPLTRIIAAGQIFRYQKSSEQHVIDLKDVDGLVLSVQFVDSILIVCQEQCVSFWQQTALGIMLGAQNMWLALGKLQRLKCEVGRENIQTLAAQHCMRTDNNITAYIELWAKEHKSEKRECPITDVFVTVYFYQATKKGNPLEKKVIQLENIKSFSQDVKYACLKYTRSVIVSWRNQFSNPPTTQIRKYQLASDFQTVSSVIELESVEHYISLLHEVKDCSEMVLGIGDLRVTIWHLIQGKLIATLMIQIPRPTPIQLSGVPVNLFYDINCVWSSYDRGFLFLLNKTGNNLLHLIAINGLRKDWKNLQVYRVPSEYSEFNNVSVEGGIITACCRTGIVCWSLHSGKILRQYSTSSTDSSHLSVFLSDDSHLTIIDQHFNCAVKNIFSFLLDD